MAYIRVVVVKLKDKHVVYLVKHPGENVQTVKSVANCRQKADPEVRERVGEISLDVYLSNSCYL